MEEKEKKPWRPPEAAHLPDPIARLPCRVLNALDYRKNG